MQRLFIVMAGCLAIAAATSIAVNADDKDKKDDKKPKYKAKEVMKKAMKGGLCKKCATGKGTDKEVKELVAMFESLAKHKPKKGTEKSWKEKTTALVKAAKGVAAKKKDAGKALQKAANCGACHKLHK